MARSRYLQSAVGWRQSTGIFGFGCIPHDTKERYGMTLQFANRLWAVKEVPAGRAGRKLFFCAALDIWSDNAGIHVTLHQHDGHWWATEAILLGEELGYGTYWYQTTAARTILM